MRQLTGRVRNTYLGVLSYFFGIFKNKDIYYNMPDSVNALVFNGRLSLDQNNTKFDSNKSFGDTKFSENRIERNSDISTIPVSLYVIAQYDINDKIKFHSASEQGDGVDDGYALTGFSKSGLNRTGLTLSLPPVNMPAISIGNISVGKNAGTIEHAPGRTDFLVTMTATHTDQGKLTNCALSITSHHVTGTLLEEYNQSQIAQWSSANTESIATATSADQLSDRLTNVELTENTAIKKAMEDVEKEYEGTDMIGAWSITFDDLATGNNHGLSRLAQKRHKDDTDPFKIETVLTQTLLFKEGEKIVTKDPFTYKVYITDTSGVEHEIVNDQIYGVLSQTAAGAFPE